MPDTAAAMCEGARMLGQGDLQERLNSLRGLWQVAIVSQTATQVAATRAW